MKQLSTVILCMLCINIYAQKSMHPFLPESIKKTLPKTEFHPQAKTQAEAWRLTGLKEQIYDGAIYVDLDSAEFVYEENYGTDHLDLLSPYYKEATIVVWDGFIWIPSAFLENSYDGEHQRTTLEYAIWDGAVFVQYERLTYSYDDDGNVTQILYEFDYGGGFENNNRELYTYTIDGDLDYYINEVWTGSDWENDTRYVYTYDDDKVSVILTQDWTGSDWEDYSRSVYLYDGEGKVTSITFQFADGGGGFDDFSRRIYTYDANDALLTDTFQYWVVSEWENDTKYEYDNNANGLPDFTYSYSWDGTVWEPYLKVINHYEEYSTTAINEISLEEITLYPNPSNDVINIQLNDQMTGRTFTITDITGKVVLSGTLNNSVVNVADLASGVYQLMIIGENQNYAGRIVKQ